MADDSSNDIPPPLLDFIEFLQQSQHSAGIIKVPSTIKDALKRYINPLPFIPLRYVSALVSAIDHEGPVICRRMDLQTFTFVYVILCRSEEGLAHQRGLSLLAESFFEPSNSSIEETTSRSDKKVQIGHKGLIPLVRELGRKDKSPLTKRWMGNLALELVRGCDQNKDLLLRKSETIWRSLGNAVLYGECGILKLVAGLTMSEVWPGGAPITEAWFSNDDIENYANFPNNEHHSSQWILAFESYVDTMVSENQDSHQRSEVFLAYSASIGNMSYCVDDESAILVTVSEDLNLMIPASQEAPAQYVDVPLSQIKDATIENTESQSQFGTLMVKSLEVLIIWTLSPINKSIFINAAHYAATSIKIRFTSPKDAEAVRNKVTRPKLHKNEELQIYQSEPIDVSQRILANKEQLETSHEYAVPADPIISIASQTNEIPNYDLSTPVELVPLRSTSYTPQPDIIKSFVQWPRKVTQDAHLQASTGDLISIANDAIEVHQFYGSSTSLRDTQQLLEDSLEPGIGSIAGWHQGAKIIENAPELKDSADRLENGGSELSERCTPVKQIPPEKLADIDSLYDATPRVEDKNRTQKQQPKSALHRRTSTQESAISPSLLTKNGVTNSITIRPAKIDEQIHKDLGSPAIESSIAAKAVIVKSTENRPAHTSMKLFTEDSSPSGHPNRSSPRSRNKKIGSSEHHRKLRTEILADGNSEIQNLYPKDTEQIQGSTSVTANLKVTRKVDIEFSPKPRLTNSPKRSDQWTKQTKPSSSGVSLRPPIKKNTKVRNSKIDDASWEVVLTDGEDSPEDSPVRKMPAKRKPKKSSKRHRNIDDNAYSVKKGLPKTATRAKKKTKSATQLEVQSTSTRAAPAMANKNHQGFTISNKSVEAQTNSSMMRPRPKVSRNQRNELSPKDLPGFKSKTYPRMMNGSLSRTLQTTIDDATAKASGDLMQPIPLLPPRIEDHDKARNLKELDILGNQVCPSQTKNQVAPPVVEPNPILDEYSNFCQEESNELGTHIASPRGRADYRRKRIIEDSQPTDADCISNVPSSFSKVRSTPAPSSKKKTLSGGRSYVDDTASLDGVENGLFADVTLIIENGAPDENLRTNDAYRAESKYTKSRIPLALQETRHSCDEKHKFVSKKPEVLISAQPEVPAAIKTKVPIAAKLESALSCVGSLHKQQFAPEAQMMKRPNAQPHKMHPASKTTYSTFEDQKQRSNQEIGVAVHSDHILKASSNSRPKPVMKLGTTQAPEEQMISGEANTQFPAKSDPHSKSGNQTLTSKKMHIVSESEESLQGDSLGGVYESKNELLKAAHKPINAMDFDEEHEPGTIIQHRLESDQTARHLFDAEVANQKYKRGYDQIQQDSRKKMRITKESKLYRTPPRQITGHDKTPEKITPDINRKSNLISFSSNGPRNQGTIMNLKDRSHDIVPDQNPEVEGNSGLKTKIETDDRDCFGSPNKPLAEGSAHNSIRVLPTLDAGLIVAQRRNSSMFKETLHKPSSQSTRVDMNGSPMPFVHSRHFGLRAQGARSPFQILGSPSAAGNMIDDGEGFAMLDLRLNDVEPRLSKLATQSPYAPMVFEFNSSGNKKQRPSSPHEHSRALGELAPHTVHADGKMVNLQTANIVMPVKPPDPFLEVEPNQGHTTSFLNLLRKSTNASYKGADGKGERPAPTTILVDSDKTLVNGNSERRKAPRDTTPPGSSSSESSDSSSCPRSLSRPRHLSNSVEESLEESSWQEALQPHQRDTLDILCEVSHRLVANLIDKETAIDDLVSDYKRVGTSIIDQFEKARQQELDDSLNRSIHLKRKLATLYKDEMTELEASMKAVKKRPVADIEKQWDVRQQALWAKMDAALAACE